MGTGFIPNTSHNASGTRLKKYEKKVCIQVLMDLRAAWINVLATVEIILSLEKENVDAIIPKVTGM